MNVPCLRLQRIGIRPSEMGLTKRPHFPERAARDERVILGALGEQQLHLEIREELEARGKRTSKKKS
jgi:hypothetical protein